MYMCKYVTLGFLNFTKNTIYNVLPYCTQNSIFDEFYDFGFTAGFTFLVFTFLRSNFQLWLHERFYFLLANWVSCF